MSELPIEYCCICGYETGHAGRADDSIYIDCGNDELGPLCDDCVRGLKAWCYDDDDGITPEETETPRRSALDAVSEQNGLSERDVTVPATEIEIAEAMRVGDPVAMTIRKLAFERDRRSALDAEVVRVLSGVEMLLFRGSLNSEEITATEESIRELLKKLGGGE